MDMIRRLHRSRYLIAIACSLAIAWAAWNKLPFPALGDNAVLDVIRWHAPGAYFTLLGSWMAILFLMPYLYIFHPLLANLQRWWPTDPKPVLGSLPPYPAPEQREHLEVILGEIHHPTRIEPSAHPRWLSIPEEGLGLGVMILGAPGTGKSAGIMLPVAKQILSYRRAEPGGRVGGLVLEVKGDFCTQVQGLLKDAGRAEDYLEIGFDSNFVYNPLHNDAGPDTLAFNLISLMKTLNGSSNDPFWEQAAEALVTFLILLHRILYGYVTLFDIYRTASDTQLVDELMAEARAKVVPAQDILIDFDDYVAATGGGLNGIDDYEWTKAEPHHMRTAFDQGLLDKLRNNNVMFDLARIVEDSPEACARLAQLESANRYYNNLKNLQKNSPNLPGSIAAGINVFLMVTDVNPLVRRVFCPPKEAYDPEQNADFRHGRPLPPLDELVESSKVIALKLPVAAEEKLARIMGTLLKQDWQRAVLNRIPRMQSKPGSYRPVVMLIDEYHLLATAGGSKAIGDEKFLNLCRGAKCIPVVALQSFSSLRDTTPQETSRTIISAFATTICGRQKDLYTAEEVSKMCGRINVMKEHFALSENDQDAVVSVATGRTNAQKKAVSISRSYNQVKDLLFEAKEIMELPRGVAVVLANTGDRQLKPTLCYLIPVGQDPRVSYWSMLDRLKQNSTEAA